VTTDVGDSRFLVAETGQCIPPRDPPALANAWQSMIEMGPEGRRQLGLQARSRVRELFSIDNVAKRFESIYLEHG
jgi:glycosyltransferase involved in cell wall biosynthesis